MAGGFYKRAIPNIIGRLIKMYRIEKKISQEELGFRAGLHRTYIGMVERGERNITVSTLITILDSLNIHLDRFCKDFIKELERIKTEHKNKV